MKWFFCIAVVAALAGIGLSRGPSASGPGCASPAAAARCNRHIVDSAVSLLKTGCLALRTGAGPQSFMLAQMCRKDKTYSHCGLVMMENGYPFVYHSIGGEDNPDARLRRDSACRFFSPEQNNGLAIAVYDFNAAQLDSLKQVVSRIYRQRPKFDLKFDLQTDDYLYCAEFVYKAVNRAVQDTGYIKTTCISGFRFVGVDDLFVNPHAKMIWQAAFR